MRGQRRRVVVVEPPELLSEENVAEAVTLAEYAKTVVGERNLKPRIRIGYEASLKNYIEAKPGSMPCVT